jgi:hypothetical protein
METRYIGSMETQQDLPLPSPAPAATIHVNDRCTVRTEGEYRVVLVAGLPFHHYATTDAVAEAYAKVMLVDSGYATQPEVARAFGCSDRSVRRDLVRYLSGGMAALATRSGWRSGRRRISSRRLRVIERLRAEGMSNCEIARRLGVSEKAIRKQVGTTPRVVPQQLTLQGMPAEPGEPPSETAVLAVTADPAATLAAAALSPSQQALLTELTATPETAPNTSRETLASSLSRRAHDRTSDRIAACFGLLQDAAPVFGDATGAAGVGVLCAVPLFVASDIFRIAHKLYGEIGPAFYGTRTTLMTLLVMALARIKRPEALKERDPQALGRLLGLDRAPEVRTVRTKLTRLASYHKAEQLGQELARVRVEQRGQHMGFLYVDGHVRVYHGKHDLPKTHVARMRLALPATTDYWVNDQKGDPLFVMTAQANAGMVKMLPEVLKEVRSLVGDRRITIVFDRGGWSPKLFQKLLAANFDILTYRKGKTSRIAGELFVERTAKIDGRSVKYQLHDQEVSFLKGALLLRQVTRLTDDGHQTPVITSRRDLSDVQVAYRMFERWRQENFFKYLREEFLLDAMADYQVEPDDPTRTVPNPVRHQSADQVRAARGEVAKLEQAYGAAAADNPEGRRPSMRGFKIAHGEIGKKLRAARAHLSEVLAQRRTIPTRVPVRDVTAGAVVKLAGEKKHLTNIIKMVAFQAESDLFALLGSHYKRSEDEGRTLLHELFATGGDIATVGDELRLTLQPLSSPHRTLAAQGLCERLTETATVFPGTNLKMCFAMGTRPEIGMAFPGPRPPRTPRSPTPPS